MPLSLQETAFARSLCLSGLSLALACGGSSSNLGPSTSDGGSSSSGSSSGGSGTSSGGSSSTSSGGSGGSSSGGESSSSSSSSGGIPEGGPLDPNAPPGTNFDLALWELQEPVGSTNSPTIISPAKLAAGFHDAYFFTDPTDGAMTFWDPENGVTTGGSDYARSELREMTQAALEASWQSTGTNKLSATLEVTMVPDHVCVGQIHTSGTKPLLELYFYASGALVLGIEQTPSGGNEVPNPVGNVPLGMKWSYVIGLSGSTISLTIDGGKTLTFPMPSSFAGQSMYFKAGDYDQSTGTSATVGATVKFYALAVDHGP